MLTLPRLSEINSVVRSCFANVVGVERKGVLCENQEAQGRPLDLLRWEPRYVVRFVPVLGPTG